jgi:iron(III) transport system substrate-binding protein
MKILLIGLCSLLISCAQINSKHQELFIASESTTSNIQPLIRAFEEDNNVRVTLVAKEKTDLLDFLPVSNADLVMSSVSEELELAKQAGLLAAMEPYTITSNVYPRFRDPENYWTGYAYRLRSIFYNLKIPESAIPRNYMDIANPDWKGKVCTRNLDQKYSYALVAWMIEKYGLEYANSWTSGLHSNMAVDPIGRDKDQAIRIIEQKCDISMANSYYYAELFQDEKTRKLAVNHLGIMLPEQTISGSFPLINGIAILKNTKNKELANKFVQHLLSYLPQRWLTDKPSFYPVRSDVPIDGLVQSFGSAAGVKSLPIVDQTPIAKIAPHFDQAKEIIHKAGFVSNNR